MIIFCENGEEVARIRELLASRESRIQIADPSLTDDQLDVIVRQAGLNNKITITTPMLGRGHDFFTTHPEGFAGVNLCTTITPNNLRQIIGRVGRNGYVGSMTSLFNKELYQDFASHDAYMLHLSQEQTKKRALGRPVADVGQYFNLINAGDQEIAAKAQKFIADAWKRIPNKAQKSEESLLDELKTAVRLEYPHESKSLDQYLANLAACLPQASLSDVDPICSSQHTYQANYVVQNLPTPSYKITSQTYESVSLNEAARSFMIDTVAVPQSEDAQEYKVY